MKTKGFILVTLFFLSCFQEPIDLENEVECIVENFVGSWEYVSTDGVRLDSIPDLEIILSNDPKQGDVQINKTYWSVDSSVGCKLGKNTRLLDTTYELRTINEIRKRNSVLLIFGRTDIYRRK